MNPPFMNNMTKEQVQANINMMNPEMMKNASSMLAGMSDSQIQMYLAQMGMPGMDPQMFRSMCQNMSNMSDSQFNSMKNMAQCNINNVNMNNSYNNNYTNNSNNNNTYSNTNDKLKGTIVEEVTKMKTEGNNLFKQEKFEEAIKKYYEAIEEIKTSLDKDKYKNELNDLERVCRLNIASCKLKTKDYDGVINECSIVLETNKCFKAYLRMGLALFHKQKYDKAFRYLDNAKAIGNYDEKKIVEPHLNECKEKLEETKKKEREERKRKEMEKEKEKEKEERENNANIKNNNNDNKIKDNKREINQKEEKENINKNEIKNEIKINENNNNNIKDKPKNKEESESKENKLNNLRNTIEKEKEKNKKNKEKEKEEEDDIKVEDTKDISSSNNNINNYSNSNFNNNLNNPPKFSQEYINQARNQINNMTDDQMREMCIRMKEMDNQTLKNLMRAQGMELTDQQIEMMKMSLSPELLRMAQNQNFQNSIPNQNINTNNINTNNINTNNNTNNNNSAQGQQMPNLGNMDITQMMEFIKKNPELLKMISPQLSQMMGGKNIDPEIMMKSMENIMWIFSIPGRIKRFMLSWRGVCLIVFIIAIFYGIFKR